MKISLVGAKPGVRGWLKVKHYATTEFIVGGVVGDPAAPQELILGRYASATGELRVAARTVPLHLSAATELGALLTRRATSIPGRLSCRLPGTARPRNPPSTPASSPSWSSRPAST